MKTWLERLDIILSILIILDIIFLIGSCLTHLNQMYMDFILIFDTVLCIVLIITFIFKMISSDNKSTYLKQNYLDLIASVPLNILIIPFSSLQISFINLVILIRALRVLLLFKESFKYVRKFFNATYLDKIIAIFIVIIAGSTFALYYFDPSIPNLYYSLWFVFQTITTVGYGDVIPKSPIGQFIGLILLVVGVLMFSILTAGFAYIFNDKVFKEENEEFNKKVNALKERIKETNDSLKETRDSLNEIKESTLSQDAEILEIKEKLEKTDESIRKLDTKIDYLIDLIDKKE